MTYHVNHKTFDWENLSRACLFAKKKGIQIAKITGKWGDPLLVPERITTLLPFLYSYKFTTEIQTNGKGIVSPKCEWKIWKNLSLDLVSISCVHWSYDKNKLIYGRDYINIGDVILFLKNLGYKIRVNCLLLKGWIDSPEKIEEFIYKFPNVDQISFIPVGVPQHGAWPHSKEFKWVYNHKLPFGADIEIIKYLDKTYQKIEETPYSSTYLYKGKSIYIAECLTIPTPEVGYRHLIYFPDGTLRYSWEDPNSIIDINKEK